jgi:transposase
MPFSRGYPQTHDMALAEVFQNVNLHSSASDTGLCEMRLDHLRHAIRKNQVTFPSQVPKFTKHDRPDLQQKLTQLYFVLGWSAAKIGARFGISRLRVQQILNTWKRRAVEVGYLQIVPPAESLRLPSEHAPIHLVFSPGGSISASAPRDNPVLAEFCPADPQGGRRPRRRVGHERIQDVLKKLEAGRTAEEMAGEVGVSACTIRNWKRQHEMRSLRRENVQLQQELVKLGACEPARRNSSQEVMGFITSCDQPRKTLL